jgi:uncharacterized HAD superfamily protein
MRIGLDIDGVCANFVLGVLSKGLSMKLIDPYDNPQESDILYWDFGPKYEGVIGEIFSEIMNDDKFWLSLRPIEIPEFDPVAYVSARPIDETITAEWLKRNGFPNSPVYHVEPKGSKVNIVRELSLDYFIDDHGKTWSELNEANLNCLLKDTSYNREIKAGESRVYSLKDAYERFGTK